MKIEILLVILLVSINAFAHEYWFEPEKFMLMPNGKRRFIFTSVTGRLKTGKSVRFNSKKRLFSFFFR